MSDEISVEDWTSIPDDKPTIFDLIDVGDADGLAAALAALDGEAE